MDILVIGGTRFFGVHLVNELLASGHKVTIATRGKASDPFGDKVTRLILDRTDRETIKTAIYWKKFDVVYDNLAYCSNDVRNVLDFAKCERYILMSTTSVYDKHLETKEGEFNPIDETLVWCERDEFPYNESKRHTECALFKHYKKMPSMAIRLPFVIGEDDYTKRLYFYVEHAIKQIPMYIDNLGCRMGFIRSDEAGKFMAYFADKDFTGYINGSSDGVISIKEILDYVESKTGKVAILAADGDQAPYNGEHEYSINTNKAKNLGFEFTTLQDWIYELVDKYIELAKD